MTTRFGLLAIVAAAGMAAPALAQDSVSTNPGGGNGLPGDALSPYVTAPRSFQKRAYVIDMADLYTSCGTRFGIAPLAKLSKTSQGFFSSLFSAQTISPTLTRAQFAAPQYEEWFAPGGGINWQPGSPTNPNDPALNNNLVAEGPTTQFGAAIAEFATDDGLQNVNNIIGTVVNYLPSEPGRLYVLRTVVAVNQPAANAPDRSQFGLGAVDAFGNVTFRADGSGVTSTTNPLSATQSYYFRVRMNNDAGQVGLPSNTGRNPAVINLIDNLGGSDAPATDWIDLSPPLDANRGSATTHNTPNSLGRDLSGTRPFAVGSNFNTFYVDERNPLLVDYTTALHRPGTTDHRGGVHVFHKPLFGGVATGAVLSKNSQNNAAGLTDSLSAWAILANGTVGPAFTFQRPMPVVDTCDPYTFNRPNAEFDHYHSQVAFRGGNGQVALGQDYQGNGLIAATHYAALGNTVPWNAIIGARFDPTATNPPATAQWRLIAWNDSPTLSGKPIIGDFGNDGIAFTGDPGEFDGKCDLDPLSPTYDAPIGRLASLNEVTGGSPVGPSISSPAFDSVGNCWFIAAVALNKADANGQPFIDFDSALIRAVYDIDNLCWRCELVLELGDTFDGNNSGTKYQVQYLEVADSNSVSSGTVYSNNVLQQGWNNRAIGCRPATDSSGLGGIVFGAKIVYDVDNNGSFEDPTSTGGNANSRDEAYQCLMYIGNKNCPSDFDGSGFVDFDDFNKFVAAFEAGDCTADFDGSGFVDFDDFNAYVGAFESGC